MEGRGRGGGGWELGKGGRGGGERGRGGSEENEERAGKGGG